MQRVLIFLYFHLTMHCTVLSDLNFFKNKIKFVAEILQMRLRQ